MLSLVPTPIGNLADISLRALELLSQCDVLLCEDTRVAKRLLFLLKERYNFVSSNPLFISVHSHNENGRIAGWDRTFFDQKVVYISDAGMPGISDPGQQLIRYCIDEGIEYDILPGANAFLSAFVGSGFVTTSVLFLGFLPHKGEDRENALQEALFSGYTTLVYESPKRLRKLLSQIDAIAPTRRLSLAKELSKKYQHYYHGCAGELLEVLGESILGEWVVTIEASASRGGRLSEADILALDIPKKSAAKLIAKLTGDHPKECYKRLLEKEE